MDKLAKDMTLKEWYMGQVLAGLLANPQNDVNSAVFRAERVLKQLMEEIEKNP